MQSRIGLGLAALGRPGYMTLHHGQDLGGRIDPAAMEAHAHAVLDAAYAGGVRYVDAARSYGRAEAFLASWLAARALAPGAITVASKWGYTYTANWQVRAARPEVKDHSVATLRRQIRESRAILGDYLSIYQIHSVTTESPVLGDAAVIDLLAELRSTGLRIGFTASGPGQAEVIHRALGVGVFDVVQATWNLLERGAESALDQAHRAGLTVVIKEALANGRLTGPSINPGFTERFERLCAAAQQHETTPDALAIAAVLARPWADVVLSGAATVPQIASNLGASALHWDAALEQCLAPLAMPSADYWRARSSFAWN
jgi:aryl-alcohol dehydrogenase-like predicted oxidoreductase